MEYGKALIIDNRDGSDECVTGLGDTVHSARANAFFHATSECKQRNKHEPYQRFVPLTHEACQKLQRRET